MQTLPNLSNYFQIRHFAPDGSGESQDRLASVLGPSLAHVELCTAPEIELQSAVAEQIAQHRPTPLLRCFKLEKALGTSCEIYAKNEGATPCGNHKFNSAMFVAQCLALDGVDRVVTETTGNWGIALAQASRLCGLDCLCFLDSVSHTSRPDRMAAMRHFGAEVRIVEASHEGDDLLFLSADEAIRFTLKSPGSVYIFGSVFNYFILPQVPVGIEARRQLADIGRYPDVVIGSCGGGASFLGIAGEFVIDKLNSACSTQFVVAESIHCPVVSTARHGRYSIDALNHYPAVETYGIDGITGSEYLGGIGSTIVSPVVAAMHEQELLLVSSTTPEQARRAALLFANCEKTNVALETGYQLAAVIDEASRRDSETILFEMSSGDNDAHLYTPE